MTDKITKRFFKFFREELDLVDKIEGHQYKIHKKILYVSMIDTIAGLIYPTRGNRDRFVQTLIKFASWDEAEYVSIPHLVRTLQLNPDPEYNQLRKYVFNEFRNWKQGSLVPIDTDVPANKVGTHWPKGKQLNEAVNDVMLESLRHAHLLYKYRNALVHSFRPLGSDFEMPEDENPYYMAITTIGSKSDDNDIYWDLIYPEVFFKKLVNNIFDNAEIHILNNKINPAEILKVGRYWLPSLNN